MIQQIYHYSREPVDNLVAEFYDRYKEHWPEEGSMKPIGLWVSVEDYEDDINWYDWCVGEQFRIDALRHKYRVILKPKTKLLHLRTADDIRQFGALYHANDPNDFARFTKRGDTPPYIYMISWKKVKKHYDGIMIAPYQWECRLQSETTWYYPWDCASGCIWNLDKVSFELESLIDVDSIKDKEESEESAPVEMVKDLQWASLGQST